MSRASSPSRPSTTSVDLSELDKNGVGKIPSADSAPSDTGAGAGVTKLSLDKKVSYTYYLDFLCFRKEEGGAHSSA